MARFYGEVRAVIARTSVTLVLDINALCLIEEVLDCDIGEVLQRYDAGAMRLADQRALLSGLLARHHPDLDLRAVGDLVSADLDACRSAIAATILAAMPEADPGKKPMAARTVTRMGGWTSRVWSALGWRSAWIRKRSGA